ncbi:polysaccharide deacetylase family protein [Flavitalea sp. BT771]|uniref:polysaccharide deacetylase family protein n=1 Tax=Flavitalea sp. BT771 TaxID=3063329 RepID=UPI0026E117F4|nr:polysaccharide deacetylase family protein [Flavitalea sp. BT771]MDO6433440.1 polysaccharide deacetylase family protein [Flavitalea sp. BT771]MDV6222655.1 polysaccharide deacetylase family protein [Flavitalea sp. BT771]
MSKSLFPKEHLRVLMYHSVSGDGRRDDLTVDAGQLEAQFRYLRTHGYTTILLSELIEAVEGKGSLPVKPVLVTFDDGFRDNLEIAYPLAKQYRIRINLFVVPAFIHQGEYRGLPCLTADDIRKMDPDLVEIGLHSFDHRSYAELNPFRLAADLELSMVALRSMDIPYQPCLAYPFGAYPRRKGLDQSTLFEILEEKGISLAFRIGNRINPFPLKHRFLVQRLDITGHDTLRTFQWSLAIGKKWARLISPLLRSSADRRGSVLQEAHG